MPNHIMKNIRSIALSILTVAGLCAVAYASEGGEGGEPSMKAFGFQVINFAIIVTILVYFARKPIRDFFASRGDSIEKSIAEASKAKAAAEAALAEVSAKLASKDAEMREIVETARKAGERERDMLIKEGERMSAKLVEQARSGIEFELKQAKEALKAEAAALAIELAEKKLGQKLTPQEQKRLFEEALAKLEAGK